MQAQNQTQGIQSIAQQKQQQTTQILPLITPHEHETNTNLIVLNLGQKHIQKNYKKLKSKFL